MKQLYICQTDWGFLAFTYAENMEEAREYFGELVMQYSPGWLSGERIIFPAPAGWTLPAREEDYLTLESSTIPYSLESIRKKLQGYRERREAKQAKARAKALKQQAMS